MNFLTNYRPKSTLVNFFNNLQFIFAVILLLVLPLFSFTQKDSSGNTNQYLFYLFYRIEENNQITINFFPLLFIVLFIIYFLIDRDSALIKWLPITILPAIMLNFAHTKEVYHQSDSYVYKIETDIFLCDAGLICLVFSIIVYYLVIFFYSNPILSDTFKRRTEIITTTHSPIPAKNEPLNLSNQLSEKNPFSSQSDSLKNGLELYYSPINLFLLLVLMLFLPVYVVIDNVTLFQSAFVTTPFGLSYDLSSFFSSFFLVYELAFILILSFFIISVKQKFTTKYLCEGLFTLWIIISVVLFPAVILAQIGLFITYPWLLLPFATFYNQGKYFFSNTLCLPENILLQRQLEAIQHFRQSVIILIFLQISMISMIFLSSFYPIVFSDFNSNNSLLNSLVLRPSLTLIIYPLIFRLLILDSGSLFNSN